MDAAQENSLGAKTVCFIEGWGCFLALKIHEPSADACLARVPKRGIPAKCGVVVFASITTLTLHSLSSVFSL